MSKDLIIRSSSAEFLIFERQTHDKGIQVRFEDGDLWLTQKSIGELFDTTRNNITMHINEIYKNFELDEKSTSKDFLLVQKEGNRDVKRKHPLQKWMLPKGYVMPLRTPLTLWIRQGGQSSFQRTSAMLIYL